MAKSEMTFDQFLFDVPAAQQPFAVKVNELFANEGYTFAVTPAKSGPVASYQHPKTRKVALNFVFRKSGLQVRIYADHICHDEPLLEMMPEIMAQKMLKSPICRRLHDPTKCNARCPMGYTFTLRGQEIKKCRYSCFLLPVTEENEGYLLKLIESEMHGRDDDA